jgi:hypothetical protein
MSRLTPCFRCGRSRGSHFTYDGHDDLDHAFVEPAPQPPAESAEQLRARLGWPPLSEAQKRANLEHNLSALGVTDGERTQPPAAPPVSGDEAVVREIVGRWNEHRIWMGEGMDHFPTAAEVIGLAVREALERGRALGARDEREACLNIAEDRVAAVAHRSAPRLSEAREIANMLRARRSGGQDK